GNPAGGAVLGALIGGLFGNAISGSGAGTVVGAAGGAMVGAAASSQATAEQRRFEVYVRFEDGGVERFIFAGPPPYRVGDAVTLTARGLVPG
ncbi:MAG TPA: glycine zipper domain-containing protein, partial [Anaeromyxobacteraceae bacterium]|nr:glycine zipper domain-containing protein [Anaeromyxobacteraceae bacterium]